MVIVYEAISLNGAEGGGSGRPKVSGLKAACTSSVRPHTLVA
jgi:hypothetical protein